MKNKITSCENQNIAVTHAHDKALESIIEGNSTTYVTRMLCKICEIDSLYSVLDCIPKIDYASIFYHKDNDMMEYISQIVTSIEYGRDLSERIKARKTYEAISPKDEEKYVILVETILPLMEEKGSGLGVNDSFPYYYNGCYWDILLKETVKEFLAECACRSGFNSFDIRVNRNSEKLYEQFQYSSTIPTPEVSKDTVLINLLNGTFEINREDQKLREFRHEDMLKYQLPFKYDPQATASMFMDFLNEVIPEKEAQMVVAEYIGYVFTKGMKLEKCLVLIGDGANGKSVLYEIICALLGEENISSYTLGNLCDDRGYYRAQLTNKLLNYSSELGGKQCNPDTIKKLISREPIDARSPYGKPFELRNYCPLMFNTNSELQGIEYTTAYKRRFIWVRFDKIIPEEKQDKELAKKIIEKELSGIFNWVLEGLNRLLVNKKFTKSKHISEASENIMNSSNTVALFIEEMNYGPGDGQILPLKQFREKYNDFCDNNGQRNYKVGIKEFSKRIKLLGFKIEHFENKSTDKDMVLFDDKSLDINVLNAVENMFKLNK